MRTKRVSAKFGRFKHTIVPPSLGATGLSHQSTNSIKRVNDVLKKATARKRQWGQFVVTGALLQDVFSSKEPRRLMDNDVEVFWSHRIDLLLA